jgi:LDH2 family malate/lactate/ureidoglycolate dehydrogenase
VKKPAVKVSYNDLRALVEDLLSAWGLDTSQSAETAQSILYADLSGISSHGIQRLPFYRRCIAEGFVDIASRPEVVRQTPSTALLDARRGLGQLAAAEGMRLAIALAAASGIGAVCVRDSNHFGTAGYYAAQASAQGLLGLCCTNSYPIMPATFGSLPLIGSNPVAFAFPSSPHDFLYDASSTVVSLGRVELYEKLGQRLPEPWGMDAQGLPTHDPSEIVGMSPEGGRGVYPLGGPFESTGGHKGYGQGLMVEILTAVLSGGLTAAGIADAGGVGACHFFAAIDLGCFGDPVQMRAELEGYCARLRSSNVHNPGQRVYIPGEKEAESRQRRLVEGLEFAAPIWEEFAGLLSDARVAH